MAEWRAPIGRGQDPAASSAQEGPNGSPAPGTISWTAPLDWLEQLLPASPMLANLRRGLSVRTPQQEEEEGATASPAPLGSHGSPFPCPALRQDHRTSTPVLGAPAGTCASPTSCQDLGPKEEEESPAPLEQAGPIAPPCLAAPEASPEGQDLPVMCQDLGTARISLPGCRCHGLWGSPLSILGDGLGVSPVGQEPSWPGPKETSTNPPCLTCAHARMPVSSLAQQDRGSGVSVASVAAGTSQLSLREAGVNTTPAEKATTTDNTAETDSLLWHCSRDQLGLLSRAELEGRLESTLIIMEALSHQIRAAQGFRPPAAPVGPAGQREAATQTPMAESSQAEERFYHKLYRDLWLRFRSLQDGQKNLQGLGQRLESANEEMRAWTSHSRQLQATVDGSFRHLQEDRKSLGQQQTKIGRLLAQARDRVQHCIQKHQEMARELEAALKAKNAANLVRESVQAGAAAKIRTLELGAKSRQCLWSLLQEAKGLQVDLLSGYGRHVAEGDNLAAALQADWAQMRLDYQGCRNIVGKCLLAHQKMAEEVKAAQTESARHQEVCQKLEKTTVELVEALGRVNELVETNARLDRDLQAVLEKVAASEEQLEQLEEKAVTIQKLQDEVARLAREKERAQQERDNAQRDFREASDCREFLEQENEVARRQLSETEEELKAALATLRERGTQLEDLKDARQKLQQEQESLRAELAGARSELQDTQAGLEGLSRAVGELGPLHAQFLEAADILQTARTDEAAEGATHSSTRTPARHTPHHPRVSLVESVLRAASQRGPKTPGLWSETTAFMRAAPAPPPKPSEIKDSLANYSQDLRLAMEQLHLLAKGCCAHVGELQAQSLQLEQQLQTSQTQHQAEMEAAQAAQMKLRKVLHLKIQSEKELQELLRHQEEKQCQLSDQKREVATLREEVAQLKLELHKSETAATTLWEEMSGSQRPDAQEKIWLRQEVGKLRELLLQTDTEHTKALTSHVKQVRLLEERLCQAQHWLQRQQKMEADLKQALSTLPAEVSSLAEVQRLGHLFD